MGVIRERLFRGSLIVLALAACAAGVVTYQDATKPTIKTFIAAYATPDEAGRMTLADTYLRLFPAKELLAAIDEKYVTGVCHTQGHAIGRSIYKKHGNFLEAINQCGSACTYGCFHGVMMEMFATDSDTLGGVIAEETPEAYLKQVEKFAHDLCMKPDVASVVRLRYCYHGLGHVFAYTSGENLASAVRSCETLDGEAAADTCQSGAFMEYLFSSAGASLMNTKGPEPCDAYPDQTSECYRYKAYGWLTAWGGVQPAFAACYALKDPILCIRALALAEASLTRVVHPEDFERLCGALSGAERTMCVEGALLRIIELNDGDDSDRTCRDVTGEYHATCIELLHRYHKETF